MRKVRKVQFIKKVEKKNILTMIINSEVVCIINQMTNCNILNSLMIERIHEINSFRKFMKIVVK